MANGSDARDILNSIIKSDKIIQDQWQVQIQAQILLKAKVYLYSDYLSDEDVLLASFHPVHNLNITINEILSDLDNDSKICVLPEGPQTIPYTT